MSVPASFAAIWVVSQLTDDRQSVETRARLEAAFTALHVPQAHERQRPEDQGGAEPRPRRAPQPVGEPVLEPVLEPVPATESRE